jgi:PEGA domain
MKRSRFVALSPVIFFFLACAALAAQDTPWGYGRIVNVSKSETSRTKAWVVNTPITEDETVFTISVHVQDKILVGNFTLRPEESPPPPEWAAGYAVRTQVVGSNLSLRAPTGSATLHITQRKAARPMLPITAEEKKLLAEMDAPLSSLIGFSDKQKTGAATETAPAPQPPPPPPATGTVNVRSTPYLSEVFVDGDSMGYTPSKIALAPGKHTFRVEKPGYKVWTKEMMITVGSELTLEATLEKK